MSVATGTAIAIGTTVAAGAGLAGSAIAGHEQASATQKAADLQSQQAANTLAFQKQVYGQTLANEQPYMNLGAAATQKLGAYPQFSFSGLNLLNDPAYKFNLAQGQQAIQRSAAAQGGLVSGGALKDLNDYTQGYAANQYQQSYSNALAAYQQAYNQLSGQAALGQNAVTQTATSGQGAAANIGAVNTGTANALSNLYTGQANATGAATLAGANAIAGGVNQYANYLAYNQNQSSYAPGSAGAQPPVGYVSPAQWSAYNAGSTPTNKDVIY